MIFCEDVTAICPWPSLALPTCPLLAAATMRISNAGHARGSRRRRVAATPRCSQEMCAA